MNNLFSRKNINLVVGLLTLLVTLWVIMFAIPGLFLNLFYTGLGNLVLLVFIVLALIFNINLGIGLLIVFMILYRFSRMSVYEGLIGGISGSTFLV